MAPTHHFIKFFILSYWSIPTFHCIVFISTANLLHFFILRFKTKRFEDERFPTIYDKKKEDFSSYSDYQYPLLVYLAFMPLKLFYHFIIKLFYHFIITFPMIKKDVHLIVALAFHYSFLWFLHLLTLLLWSLCILTR